MNCTNKSPARNNKQRSAFTVAEVMVVMGILGILFAATFSGISSMILIAHRTADYSAGVALSQAEIHDIRAVDYPGTNGIFSFTTTTTNISSVSVDLNQAGTTFIVPGTLVSIIQPISWGHLVTVSLIVKEPNGLFMTNTLQTVVNQYSGGRGE